MEDAETSKISSINEKDDIANINMYEKNKQSKMKVNMGFLGNSSLNFANFTKHEDI